MRRRETGHMPHVTPGMIVRKRTSPFPNELVAYKIHVLSKMHLNDAEVATTLDSTRGRYLYIGYIVAIALVDLSVLLLLLKLKAWQHVVITLTLSLIGITCISLSLVYSGRAAHRRTQTIRALIDDAVRDAVRERALPPSAR